MALGPRKGERRTKGADEKEEAIEPSFARPLEAAGRRLSLILFFAAQGNLLRHLKR